MAANSWALACVCLTLGQTPSDSVVTKERSLSVPVNIQDARRAELRELLLFASNDQGRTWQQVAAMPPTQNAFTFTAPLDGNYWLRVATINQQGKQDPDNLYQPGPTQKVVIDTMKPLLRLNSATRQGDDVALAWSLQEDNPDWSSFRLEYQPKEGGSTWTPIQANAGLSGQVRFRPAGQGAIVIRLSLRDQAGNQGLALADVAGTIMPAVYTQPAGTPGTAPPPPMFPPLPTGPAPTGPAPSASVPAGPTPAAPAAVELPPPTPIAETPKMPPPPAEPLKTFPMNPAPAPWTTNSQPAKNEPGRVVASSVPAQNLALPAAPAAPQRQLPPVQFVNHPDVTLEYELARVGPSGVGSIDLWWTQNDGQTWELYAVDPESKSGTVANGRHKRTVELPGDGAYGFVLVVRSKAGLGKGPPKAGETPDIRVEVDTTAPVAKLFEPEPDSQKPNTLLLKWSAQDNNLTNTPIVLEWSEKREGPWQQVAAPLANVGRHSWQLPTGLPVQVYLRLRVRDQAGNEGIAVTRDPQLVDLSEPEGRLINVSVSPR